MGDKMPIFEFHCNKCGKEFEEIVHSKDFSISCPQCSSTDTKKLISVFSFKSGGNGGMKTSSSGGCSSCMSKNCGSCS